MRSPIGLKPLVGAIVATIVWSAAAMPPAEEARALALFARIESADGAVFIRNGREHNAAHAAEFLRRKCVPRFDRYADAAQLVCDCAACSLTSGEIYRIRLAGETAARPSAEVRGEWLRALPPPVAPR